MLESWNSNQAMSIELIPPLKDKSVFVLYIVQQPNGIVTASSDYIGKSDEVLSIGMDVMTAVNSIAYHLHDKLVVHNKVQRLDAQ